MLIEKVIINKERELMFHNFTIVKSGNRKGKSFLFDILYFITGATFDENYFRKGTHLIDEIEIAYSNGECFKITNPKVFFKVNNEWKKCTQESIKDSINRDYIGENNIFKDDSFTFRSYMYLNFLPESGYGILEKPFPFIDKLEEKQHKKIKVPDSMDLLLKKFEVDELEHNNNAQRIINAKKTTKRKIKRLEAELEQEKIEYSDLENKYFTNSLMIESLKDSEYIDKNIEALRELGKSKKVPSQIKQGLVNILERNTYFEKINNENKVLISDISEENQEIQKLINLNDFERKIRREFIEEDIKVEQEKLNSLKEIKEIESSFEIKKKIEDLIMKYVLLYDDSPRMRQNIEWMNFDEVNYELTFYDDKVKKNIDIGSLADQTVFNTALLLSFHEYMLENNIPHLKLLVLDTSSQPFDQTKEQQNFSNYIKMLENFTNAYPDMQIIMIEKSGMCDLIDLDEIHVIDLPFGLVP